MRASLNLDLPYRVQASKQSLQSFGVEADSLKVQFKTFMFRRSLTCSNIFFPICFDDLSVSSVPLCRLVLGPPNLTASEAVNPTAPLEESHEPPARPVERGLKKVLNMKS